MEQDASMPQAEKGLEGVGTLIARLDRDGAIVYASGELLHVSGFLPEELSGLSLSSTWHEDMPEVSRISFWLTLKAGKTFCGIVKNRCKDGSHFWTETVISPMREDVQITGYISSSRAPTREQVESAEALYQKIRAGENRRRLQQLHQISYKLDFPLRDASGNTAN